MDEFDLIARYFAPLTEKAPGAFNLTDDAACVSVSDDCELVVTKDAIVEGVHFFSSTLPDLLAKKLLRVNLSDIAAMGAKPLYYLIAATLPRHVDESWIAGFARGLEEDQQAYGISLIGGDTTAHDGPLSLSLTMLGEVKKGQALRRNGAKPGDSIYVSGTIGDSALGLCMLQGTLPAQETHKPKYHLPEPQVELGQKLVGIAHAAIDISDGLLADLGHICHTSGVAAIVEVPLVPLSTPVRTLLTQDASLLETILTGGDDYELLFASHSSKIYGLPVTRIGAIVEGSGVRVRDEKGALLRFSKPGFKHF